jgi:hypothetical protein
MHTIVRPPIHSYFRVVDDTLTSPNNKTFLGMTASRFESRNCC